MLVYSTRLFSALPRELELYGGRERNGAILRESVGDDLAAANRYSVLLVDRVLSDLMNFYDFLKIYAGGFDKFHM